MGQLIRHPLNTLILYIKNQRRDGNLTLGRVKGTDFEVHLVGADHVYWLCVILL